MKRLFLAIVLCSLMLTAAGFLMTRRTTAQSDLVISLLAFPAPPPKGTVFEPAPPKRPDEFYSKSKVPDDDAPIDELMDYWSHHGIRTWETGYFPRPSRRVVERIKDKLERNPKELTNFLRLLPFEKETSLWVKKLYNDEVSARVLTTEWRSSVREWLVQNSSDFSDELAKRAENAKDDEGYISGLTDLVALAKVDWDKAKPVIDRMLLNPSQPNTIVAAKWAQYAHAIESGSESDAERYRSELQRIVEDRNASPAQRDLALDALVKEKEWSGRDEWYFSLFSDETLLNLETKSQTLTGLTTIVTESAPGKYKARLIRMVESGDPNVRNAAVQALSRLCDEDAEAAVALLPWLDNPNWAKDTNNSRSTFLKSLAKHKIPESVPGLIALLDEITPALSVPKPAARSAANTAANTAQHDEGERRVAENYRYRGEAIDALKFQGDPRAVPALRRLLFGNPLEFSVLSAVWECGGFSSEELAQGLEAQMIEQVEAEAESNSRADSGNSSANEPVRSTRGDLFVALGNRLLNESKISDETASAIARRADSLEMREPATADRMRKALSKWKGAGVNIALLNLLKRGKVTPDGVIRLLIDRKSIRERQSSWVSDTRTASAYADGIAACIMEDHGAFESILESGSAETRAALYACGRLIRAEFPIARAAADMNSKNGILSLAAEKYLETVDTPEARALVLAKHKGEAKILGPVYFFEGVSAPDPQKAWLAAELVQSVEPSLDTMAEGFDFTSFYLTSESFEADAKRLVRQDKGLVKVYAFKNFMLRQYPDKVLFSRADKTGARFWERELHPGEFEALENLLANERVEDIKPVLATSFNSTDPSGSEIALEAEELLILGRDGGHRIFYKSWNRPRALQEVDKLFTDMSAEEGRPVYYFEFEIPGAATIYAGTDLRATTFWKNGPDMRVLVNNIPERKKIRQELDKKVEEDLTKPEFNVDTGYQEVWKQRRRRRWESFSWYYLAGSSLGAPAPQPDGVEFIPQRDSEGYLPDNDGWKARAQGFEIRADENGIYKIAGGRTTLLRKGGYAMPVVSPDGRYVIAQRLDRASDDSYGDVIVKMDIAAQTEKPLKFTTEQDRREPVAFIPSRGKFLIFTGYYQEHEDGEGADDEDQEDFSVSNYEDGEFFFLDPVTNVMTPANQDFAAFAHQTFRPLQPTGRPNEFWAAMPSFDYDTSVKFTRLGVVNSRTGKFKTLVTLNKVFFDSMALWVEDKVYFAYQGHIVSIPKPKLPAAP